MPGRKVIFRGDGDNRIGYGHVFRLLAIADMTDPGEAEFYIQRTDDFLIGIIRDHGLRPVVLDPAAEGDPVFFGTLKGNELVVLDGYAFRSEYQQRIKAKGCRLVYVDDLHGWHIPADLVLNHAFGLGADDYNVPSTTELCLGPRFLMLRKSFLDAARTAQAPAASGEALVCFGGADPDHHAPRAVRALLGLPDVKTVHVLHGAATLGLPELQALRDSHPGRVQLHSGLGADEMVRLMRSCSFALTSASTVALECCALRLRLYVAQTADNQADLYRGLAESGAAYALDSFSDLSQAELREVLKSSLDAGLLWEKRRTAQLQLIDGRSGERIAERLRALALS